MDDDEIQVEQISTMRLLKKLRELRRLPGCENIIIIGYNDAFDPAFIVHTAEGEPEFFHF